jgi:hypothetical protein
LKWNAGSVSHMLFDLTLPRWQCRATKRSAVRRLPPEAAADATATEVAAATAVRARRKRINRNLPPEA